MVDIGNPVSQIGGAIADKIFSGIAIFGIAIIAIGIICGIFWYFVVYRRKFDIEILIKSDRSGDRWKLIRDKGAILIESKTGSKFLKLRDLGKELPVPPYQVLQASNKGDVIELWRKSEDEFIYLTPGTINKRYIIRQDGSEYPMAMTENKQVEGDISYWNIKRKEKNKTLFSTDSWLMKLLPYLPQILGTFTIIFILYILLDKLPTILTTLKDLVEQMKQLQTAQITSTSIIGGLLYGRNKR